MPARRAYLDWNASAPLLPEARVAFLSALDLTANPSSVHAEGRQARRLIEDARRDVAGLCNARSDHVVFTSGASEAAALVLTPDWRMGRAPLTYSKLYTSAADHPIIVGGGRFAARDVVELPVDRDGRLDLNALNSALAEHDRSLGLPLVALHLANNETGVIQLAGKISEIVHDAGGVLVLDAAQAAGRISIDISALSADFVVLSAHKMGGPKGAGALVGRSDVMMPAPIAAGGGQEHGHRAGTENYAAIAGFGAAARMAAGSLAGATELRRRRDEVEAGILRMVPDAIIFARDVDRLPNTIYFAIPGVKAETAQIAFDLAGVALSTGSACSSGKVGASRVLEAMGYRDDMSGIRVSFGASTGTAEFDAFADALRQFVRRRDKAA